jgi:hypothetical protein
LKPTNKDAKKPWNNKDWKEKRSETITDSSVCELCGSNENLVIHHPDSKNFRKINQLVDSSFYYSFSDYYSKNFPTKEEIEKYSTLKKHRHRSHDYWHKEELNHKFEVDNSEMQERIELTKEFKEFDRTRFKTLFNKNRQFNKEKIEKEIEKAYVNETEKYNNFENIQIICKRCHWAIHNNMNLCPICKKKYKKSNYEQCFDCLPDERKKQIEKRKEPDFDDPFAPNLESEKIVKCMHCCDTYKESEIKWDSSTELWVCKNFPSCNGSGLGWEIFYIDTI